MMACMSTQPNAPARLLSSRELAEVLGVHVSTVWRRTRSGDIPYVQVGQQFRFDLDTVLEHLERHPEARP